jgi:hypothetical protein
VFVWRYLDAEGNDVGASDRFADREDAESWVGDSWEQLLERGVERVSLIDEGAEKRLYTMGLRED